MDGQWDGLYAQAEYIKDEQDLDRELIEEGEAEMRMLQAEMLAEAELARYDDDPNPYHGDYSEC